MNAIPLRHRRSSAEGGQVLVIFVGGLVTLILFVGLVMDGGFAFVNRRQAQNVADTAALAGTKVLADHYLAGPLTAVTNATVYASIDYNVQSGNDCRAGNATPCSWEAKFVDRFENVVGTVRNNPSGIPFGAQGVLVNVTMQPRTFFLGVIGQTHWDVGAGATALTGQILEAPPWGVLPIATNPPQPLEENEEYVLTDIGASGGGSSPDFGPGNFGWLSWYGDNSAGALANSICHPDNPAFSLNPPTDFPGDPGATNANAVRACLEEWVQTGTPVLIPIVSGCDPCNGNPANFTITGLRVFILTGYDDSGPAITSLTGVFMETYPLPSAPSGIGGPPQPGDGQAFIGLVR
jgi:hypothetical protein